MDSRHLNVRLTIFSDPKDSGRAFMSISESPFGGTDWEEVDLTSLKAPLGKPWEESLYILAHPHEDEDNSRAKEIGKEIYNVMFGSGAGEVFRRSLGSVNNPQTLRLAIDCQAQQNSILSELPWELLHDGAQFISSRKCSIIRIDRNLSDQETFFGPLNSVAIITAMPSANDSGQAFNQSEYCNQLKENLSYCPTVEFVDNATRKGILKLFENRQFDLVYFLGYGRPGEVILHNDNGGEDIVNAGDFAQLISGDDGKARLIYLNCCYGGTPETKKISLSSIANVLLREKVTHTVVAMQSKIELKDALSLAAEFLDRAIKLGDPEEALAKARLLHSDNWLRSIPNLFTHVDGPEKYRRNRLMCLLLSLIHI